MTKAAASRTFERDLSYQNQLLLKKKRQQLPVVSARSMR